MLNPKIIPILKKLTTSDSITEDMRIQAFDLIHELIGTIHIGEFPVDIMTAKTVKTLLIEKQKIQAIKYLRETGGKALGEGKGIDIYVMGLKEAKEAVEEWEKKGFPMPM